MKTRALKSRARYETVAAVHQRKAQERREALAAIASMPATGAPYASNTASINTPAIMAGEIGFAAQSGNPAARATAGWSKASAAAEKERIG